MGGHPCRCCIDGRSFTQYGCSCNQSLKDAAASQGWSNNAIAVSKPRPPSPPIRAHVTLLTLPHLWQGHVSMQASIGTLPDGAACGEQLTQVIVVAAVAKAVQYSACSNSQHGGYISSGGC